MKINLAPVELTAAVVHPEDEEELTQAFLSIRVQTAGLLIVTLPDELLVGMFVVMVTVPAHAPVGVGTTMPVIDPPDTLATEVTEPDPVQVEFQE
jgi:hypothetical protein